MEELNEQKIGDAVIGSLDEYTEWLRQKKFFQTPRDYISLSGYHPESKEGRFSRDDVGVARLFSEIFQNKHRYNSTRKTWMYYNGIKWCEDEAGLRAAESLKLLQYSLIQHALHYAPDDEKFLQFVVSYGSHSKRRNVLTDAQSVFPLSDEDLDKNPYLFNCQDCTIDLETGKAHEHSASDLISKVSNVYFKTDVDKIIEARERWEKFVDEIMEGDEPKKAYLKRMIGYCLTSSTSEECFFILYGPKTRNGKSTFIEPIRLMLGEYAATTEPATFQATKQAKEGGRASPQLAGLAGMRMIITSEAPQNMTFDEALLKTLTGGDTVYARRLHENGFNFKPQFKLIMNTNHLPRINDNTLFKGDRVRVVTFDRQFSEEERDKKLKQKLSSPESLSGIFQWALEGYSDFLIQHGLNEPKSVLNAIKKYDEDSDTIKQFVDDVLIPTDGHNVSGTSAYIAYRNWIISSGQQPLGKFNFFKILKERFIMDESGYVGKSCIRNVIKNKQIDLQWLPEGTGGDYKKKSGGIKYSERP